MARTRYQIRREEEAAEAQARQKDEARDQFEAKVPEEFRFDGSRPGQTMAWIDFLNETFEELGTPSELKVGLARSLLRGVAFTQFYFFGFPDTEAGWQEMTIELLDFFLPRLEANQQWEEDWRAHLADMGRHPDEPMEAHLERLEVNIIEFMPDFPEFEVDHLELINTFKATLPEDLRPCIGHRAHLQDALNDVYAELRARNRAIVMIDEDLEEEEEEDEDPEEFFDEDLPEAMDIAPEQAAEGPPDELSDICPSDLEDSDEDDI